MSFGMLKVCLRCSSGEGCFDILTFMQSIPFMKHIRGGLREGTRLYIQGSIPENISMWVQKVFFHSTLWKLQHVLLRHCKALFFFSFANHLKAKGTPWVISTWAEQLTLLCWKSSSTENTVPLLSNVTPPCQNRKIWGLNAGLLIVNGEKDQQCMRSALHADIFLSLTPARLQPCFSEPRLSACLWLSCHFAPAGLSSICAVTRRRPAT